MHCMAQSYCVAMWTVLTMKFKVKLTGILRDCRHLPSCCSTTQTCLWCCISSWRTIISSNSKLIRYLALSVLHCVVHTHVILYWQMITKASYKELSIWYAVPIPFSQWIPSGYPWCNYNQDKLFNPWNSCYDVEMPEAWACLHIVPRFFWQYCTEVLPV